MKRFPLACALALSAALPAAAQNTCTESFENGVNSAGWTWGLPTDVIQPAGGNPDAWFASGVVDTFGPTGRTTLGVSSNFTGNYRSRGVSTMGIDLQTVSTQFPNSCMRPISLILISDPGTPGDPNDDCGVYFVAAQAPCPGGGWSSYDVTVPSQNASIPVGWAALFPCDGDPNAAWNTVMTDVDQVRWFFGDPTFFYIFEQWRVGMDNPRITDDQTPTLYCTGKTNSLGCVPFLSFSGRPSVTLTSPFSLTANELVPGEAGFYLYGVNGRLNLDFHGGKLCVKPPLVRWLPPKTPSLLGTPPCTGRVTRNFNSRIQSGLDPQLTPGRHVYAQFRQRDPNLADGFDDNLSNAIDFIICP